MGRLMKDSGIEWCLEIPSNWQVMPNKRIMHKVKDICEKYDGENILSLTMNGVIIRDLDAGGKMPTSFDGYQRVVSGNLLMCLFDIDVTPRCIGLICNNGLTSPAYSQFELKSNAYAPYYYYYYLMLDNTKELLHLAKNLRHSFTEEQLGGIMTPVPPYAEQQKIADFLDRKCREVDELIALEEKMTEELKAYKQSAITETITKGLNPDVPMKDSGIEWIGQIPEHWEVMKMKRVLSNNDGGVWGNEPTGNASDSIVIRSTEQTVDGYWDIQSPAMRDLSEIKLEPYKIHKGDLLMTKSSGSASHIGKTTIAGDYFDEHECYYSNFIQRLRCNNRCIPLFVWNIMNCQLSREQFIYYQNATSGIGNINSTIIGDIFIPVPPIYEQDSIVKELELASEKIKAIIGIKQSKIAELQDYKKSIIYEYATGKKEIPTL